MSDKILKLEQAQTLYQDLRGRIDALPTSEDIPTVPVQDVQVNGTSVLSQGVANVPMASNSVPGVVMVDVSNGVAMASNGNIYVQDASDSQIKAGTAQYRPISPRKQDASAFYGLAKAAGADMKDIANTTIGTYPDAQKAAIQNMLGITDLISTEESSTATAAHAINSTFMMGGKLHRATAAIAIGDAVVVGMNCEVVKADEVFVKKTDIAGNTGTGIHGIVRISEPLGVGISNGYLYTAMATDAQLKAGENGYQSINPKTQHKAVYFGLSKLAGVDLASETVTVGTYPETSKAAIRSLIGAGTPLDVQINGTSIVSSGVANILVSTDSGFGITSGSLYISTAGAAQIKAGSTTGAVLKPNRQHEAVFYGLTKAAGVDMASSSNAVGTYTDAAKVAIRNMLGATSSNVIAVQDEQPTDGDTKIWLPETESTGIEVPTYAEFQALDAAVVKKTDYATTTAYGLLKVGSTSSGLQLDPSGYLKTYCAQSDAVKAGTDYYKPIVPAYEHSAVYYGLSKAAGVDLASETVTVGTYPATASAAIRTMIGAVSNTDYATTSTGGVVKVNSARGLNIGVSEAGVIGIEPAQDANIKAGNLTFNPICPIRQHIAVFYGLAKAAGDTTMSSSSNEVGTYTTEAKAAIHTMLGIDPASIAAQVDIPLVETISSTTPTITGQPNVRYVCGEVSTISITPPASGSVDVIFESGSTAAVLTVPNTVKWPAWFDATSLEADTIYEILITDGVYGSVMTWAT